MAGISASELGDLLIREGFEDGVVGHETGGKRRGAGQGDKTKEVARAEVIGNSITRTEDKAIGFLKTDLEPLEDFVRNDHGHKYDPWEAYVDWVLASLIRGGAIVDDKVNGFRIKEDADNGEKDALEIEKDIASGHGGQGRQHMYSRVTAIHKSTRIRAQFQTRSPKENEELARTAVAQRLNEHLNTTWKILVRPDADDTYKSWDKEKLESVIRGVLWKNLPSLRGDSTESNS